MRMPMLGRRSMNVSDSPGKAHASSTVSIGPLASALLPTQAARYRSVGVPCLFSGFQGAEDWPGSSLMQQSPRMW